MKVCNNRLAELESIGGEALRKHRQDKLSRGLPFMINLNELQAGQFYYEYNDRKIELIVYSRERNKYNVLKVLSKAAVARFRKKHKIEIEALGKATFDSSGL